MGLLGLLYHLVCILQHHQQQQQQQQWKTLRAYCAFTFSRTLFRSTNTGDRDGDDMHAINRNGKLNIKSPVNFLCGSKMKCFIFFLLLHRKVNKRGHATVLYCIVLCCMSGYTLVWRRHTSRLFKTKMLFVVGIIFFISPFVRWERVFGRCSYYIYRTCIQLPV